MDVQPTLLDACIKGERRAEYELYKVCFSYLMSICIRYTRSEEKAREVLNSGFYKILTSLGTFNQSQPFKPWARKVMINTLINEFKKETSHRNHIYYTDTYHESADYAALNHGLDKVNADQIYGFIAKLPPATMQVFNLYFIDGYRHREIAEMLEISEGTSKWHLNSAREKLREMLENVKQPAKLNTP